MKKCVAQTNQKLVDGRAFHQTVAEIKARNAAVPAEEIEAAIDEALAAVRIKRIGSRTKPRPPRRVARHRTGRNRQLNVKATAETIERFYKLADQRRVALGELLEQALDALEKSAGQGGSE